MTQDGIRAYLAAIGRKGGQSKSPRKAAQSRANGAKRKKITEEREPPPGEGEARERWTRLIPRLGDLGGSKL